MLKVEHLNFRYQGLPPFFKNVKLTLPSKGLVFFCGPNGSGKTTLIRILSTFVIPESGQLTLDGHIVNKSSISYMPANQESFFVHLTGQECLELFARLNNSEHFLWEESRFRECETLTKALETKFAFCSTGMKQTLNFFRALSTPAQIYLLDEPFRALDKRTKEFCIKELNRLKNEALIIISGHELLDKDLAPCTTVHFKDGEVSID